MMNIRNLFSALLCFLLWAHTATLRAQTEGVAINTENLQGIFHVDAAANDAPPPDAISPAQQEDDVVVSEEGYVGIGILTPSARLHIRSGQGTFPLRLSDGSEGNSKMLTSDDAGIAYWQMPPVPPSSTVYDVQIAPRQNFPLGDSTEVINTAFPVQEDGFYSADVRFWAEGIYYATGLPIVRTVTQIQLRKNGVTVDEFQYNEAIRSRLTCFVTLYTPALQGDVLSLWIYPVEGFAAGLTANPVATADYDYIKTKVLYKKMGVNDGAHYFD
jgi:hypothetical protein